MDSQVTQILLNIVLAVLTGSFAIALVYAKKKWGVEKTKDALSKVEEVVRAAEVAAISLGLNSAEKKKWALEQLSKLTNIDPATLALYIEAAVSRLKTNQEELGLNDADKMVPKYQLDND